MHEKIIDLHTHTLFSDGRESLENLLKMAQERNIEILSITDHESIYVYDVLKENNSIKIITGVELSAFYKGNIIHVLGYGFDVNNENMRKYCDDIFETSLKRTYEYLKILDKYNIVIPDTIVKEHIENKYPLQYERLFSIMYKLNIPFDRETLENEFLVIKKKIKMPYLKVNEAVKLINDANGYAIVAHPYKYKWDDVEDNLDILISQGIVGVECYHSDAPKEFMDMLVKYCKRNSLLISGGSDAHKYYKNTDNKRSLGYGTMNNLSINKGDVSFQLIKLAKNTINTHK